MRHSICGILLSAAAFSAVFASAVPVRAETCSLDLKYREGNRRNMERKDYLYWATSAQRFFAQLMPQKDGPPIFQGNEQFLIEFKKLAKKEPKYQSKIPFRGVVEFGGQKYAFALDEFSPKPKEEKPKPDTDGKKKEKKKADTPSEKLAEKLDKQQPKQKPIKYTRLYLDRNRNGDLTDDEVIESKEDDLSRGNISYSQISFPKVEITLDAGGTKYKYAFTVSGYAMLRKDYGYVSLSFNSAACREGEITLNGKKHRIVLADFNSNGRFNDEYSIDENIRGRNNELYPRQGDVLMVDPDFNNVDSFSPYDVTASDYHHLVSKMIVIDDRFYDVKISPSGDKLTLTPSAVVMGSITNPNKKFRALIYGDKGFLKIAGEGDVPIPVPEGEWKLFSYNIDLTDYPKPEKPKVEISEKEEPAAKPADSKKKSITKSLSDTLLLLLGGGGSNRTAVRGRILYTRISAQATKDYEPVKVVEGKTSVFPFGPPYKPLVVVQGVRDKSIYMALNIVGSKGEVCSDMTVRGGRPSKPSFKITNSKGEVVQQGNFEYG